jgi:recombination protein RecT
MTQLERQNHPTRQLATYLAGKRVALEQWAQNRIDPAALIRFALMDFQKSKQLQKCSPESIYLALIACAQVGLEPGGIRQEAFIVPYGNTATFQLGYRGILRLARETPGVSKVSANVVYFRDDFDVDIGTDARVRHRPFLGEDRGEIVGAYAFAMFASGELDVEFMSRADLDKIKSTAKTTRSDSPWQLWEDQMFRKSPIRRLGKRLPLGERSAFGFQLDAAGEGGDVSAYREAFRARGVEPDVVDVPNDDDGGVDRLKKKVKRKRKPVLDDDNDARTVAAPDDTIDPWNAPHDPEVEK